MKTIRKKRSAEPTAAHHRKTILQELMEIRQELADLSVALRRTPSCSSSHDTRYLSESEAAQYQPAAARLSDANDTIRFCQEHFQSLIQRGLQEEMHVLTLNGNNRVIRSHQVTIGLLNSTPVHPREIFRPAILDAAASIMLVHNHPSGNPKPSPEDLKVTENIEAAGKLIGIKASRPHRGRQRRLHKYHRIPRKAVADWLAAEKRPLHLRPNAHGRVSSTRSTWAEPGPEIADSKSGSAREQRRLPENCEQNSNLSDVAGAAPREKPEANAWRYHQAPDSTFDGTLIGNMSLDASPGEESSAKGLATIGAAKRTFSETLTL